MEEKAANQPEEPKTIVLSVSSPIYKEIFDEMEKLPDRELNRVLVFVKGLVERRKELGLNK